MSRDVRIEFPSAGATYNHQEYGVYEYGEYPDYSVLAGQTRRQFLESFETLNEAKIAYPDAEFVDGSGFAPVSLNHLPGEDDQ